MARITIGPKEGYQTPIIQLPKGEPITLRSQGWDILMTDTTISFINRNTQKAVMKFTSTEIIIGNPDKEAIVLTQ